MPKTIKRDWFFLLIIFILAIFFFGRLLFLNFAQDDFHGLFMARAESLKDYLNFLTFKNSLVTSQYNFYRPLTTQIYFALNKALFGLNPFFYHLESLLLHFLNIFLVYKLAKLFFPHKSLPILAALFYGLNQCQTITIGWASNFQELGVTFFILTSTIFFYKNLKTQKTSYLFISFFSFALSLLCKETAIVLPLALFVTILFYGKKKDLFKLLPFVLILAYYLYMHFVKYPYKQTESYPLLINHEAINTLKWYVFWALGLPEMFLDYIGPRFTILRELWKMFFYEAVTIFSLFITLNIAIIIAIFSALKKLNKNFLFFILFYLIFLIPIIFFPRNKYTFHETTSLAGFSITLAFLTSTVSSLKLKLAIILSFLLLSANTVSLTLRTHWLIGRTRITDSVLMPFLKKYPTLPENTVIYIKNDPNYPKINKQWGNSSKQAWMALSGENAFKVYYGNTIKVYYEGVKDLPKKIETPKFIEYTATIPF